MYYLQTKYQLKITLKILIVSCSEMIQKMCPAVIVKTINETNLELHEVFD